MLYSIILLQQYKDAVWTVNLNTGDKQAAFIFFIFSFFTISELSKHINASNNLIKR